MGCDAHIQFMQLPIRISIHASRMGCDNYESNMSTISIISIHASRMGCDLRQVGRPAQAAEITFHASRMGCDLILTYGAAPSRYFNPRIPYGMRLAFVAASTALVSFQSTHPVWDATIGSLSMPRRRSHFIPRIPYGMRLALGRWNRRYVWISIHASRMGCD